METDGLIELQERLAGRRCVVFGAGPTSSELLELLEVPVEFIVDNDRDHWGREIRGIPVRSPEALVSMEREDLQVVIASTAVEAISAQLESMGFTPGTSFVVSPTIGNNDPLAGTTHPNLLVSGIGDNAGLYLFDINANRLEKVLDGDMRGLARLDDGYLVVREFRGILRLNRDLTKRDEVKLEGHFNLHGICTDPEGKSIYVAETGRDSIGIYDYGTLQKRGRLNLRKRPDAVADQHHVNDVKWFHGRLYVSMFSLNGIYRDKVWSDGVVAAIDPCSGTLNQVVVNGLSQPHSLVITEDEILCCNSMNCEVRSQTAPLFGANGYLRGLAVHKGFYYIGQSRMRRISRYQGQRSNISLDSGIHVWNRSARTSRFLHVPMEGVFDILPVLPD